MIDAVVVSGAGSGIGRQIAMDISNLGIKILCLSKSKNCVETAKKIRSYGGIAEAEVIDISNIKKTHSITSNWLNKIGAQKIGLVLAAGILGPKEYFSVKALEEWDKCFQVNVLGNLAIISGAMKKMQDNSFGRIVAFSGGGSAYANPIFPAYSASKTAMVRTIENLHEKIKDKGDFSVVCVAPGAVDTNMLKEFRAEGGIVKTTTDIMESVTFVRKFICSQSCTFSGRFVHVRDNWSNFLNTDNHINNDSYWKLRRVEK